jgi:hypothetical protein
MLLNTIGGYSIPRSQSRRDHAMGALFASMKIMYAAVRQAGVLKWIPKR